LVPFSPLGRGFLAGAFRNAAELPASDFRQNIPRLKDANAVANARILELIQAVAGRHQATPAQVALAWLLAQGQDVVPIPGTRRRKTLDQNLDAVELRLTSADLQELGQLAGQVAGERYTPAQMASVER
jgi:aryl-alcohol dehydrogenase-like predicted oxidoreductase